MNGSFSLVGTYLGLLSLLEESLLSLLLVLLLLGEVAGGGDLLDGLAVNAADVHALAGGDHVASVHPSEGNTVDLEGTGDEENTLVKVLEENDALATEATGKEDEDSTGLKAFANLGGTNSLADLLNKAKKKPCQNPEPITFTYMCIILVMKSRRMRFQYKLMVGRFNAGPANLSPGSIDPARPSHSSIRNRIRRSFRHLYSFCTGCTDFLGLRLVINRVPFLGLLGRHKPLGLSKLLRRANVRHFGC